MTGIDALFVIVQAFFFALLVAFLEPHLVGMFNHFRQSRYQKRLQTRLARGEDSYFEELRSIESTKPVARPLGSFLTRTSVYFAWFSILLFFVAISPFFRQLFISLILE